MARDEHGLQATGQDGVPRLRLYTWDRLTLSVGRAQQVERQIDLGACSRLGIPVVRRITGGRAVLHGSDLTYSLAAPLAGSGSAAPFEAAAREGIPGLYREVSRVFVRFFDRLGLAPQVQAHTGRQRAESASPVCFATPSAFEILLDGRKIVGSAQRLLPGAFLQHGSIPLAPQEEILARVFLDDARLDMARRMTDLETAGTLRQVTLGELRTLLAECFAEVLGAVLAPATWSEAERSNVRGLAAGYTDLASVLPVAPPAPAAR